MTTAIEIIQAFDAEIVRIWGANLGRMYPHPKDKVMADRWIAAGATLPICVKVFKDCLERRHVKGEAYPTCLSYFENPIKDAIIKSQAKEPDDPVTSQWKARLSAWREKKLWLDEQWGARPGEEGCRVPRKLLQNEMSCA